ncbi:hypothetical protein [Franconibacter pulveris]|uniref:hypothetical protein n=1 Tax=Franconibacter pulveris TaxID=435910 RepID=UPI0004986AF7|nr:hypothetical protein [Franconibacter pulveris]
MDKLIILIIKIVISTYVITICLICLSELEKWQDKTIAVIMTIGSAYIITLVLNLFSPKRIHITDGIFDLLSGPLLITGSIACIALLDPWPVKIIGLFLWVAVMLYIPSLIDNDKE